MAAIYDQIRSDKEIDQGFSEQSFITPEEHKSQGERRRVIDSPKEYRYNKSRRIYKEPKGHKWHSKRA